MNPEQIKYKLFDLDEAMRKQREQHRKEEAYKRLPKIYKMTPQQCEDIINGEDKSNKKK